MGQGSAEVTDDPNLWLEEVFGSAALEWVAAHNAHTDAMLTAREPFARIEKRMLAAIHAEHRIPFVVAHGGDYYNFWQDGVNPRGLWRRCSAERYGLADPHWDVLLDVDALSRRENESWVFQGAQLLYPSFNRALMRLSRGGGDAHVMREFDLPSKSFVKDGFVLHEAKCAMEWIDYDTVYVATDFGPGSTTQSGYPRQIKKWRRAAPLAAASLVFEGSHKDISVDVTRTHHWIAGELVWCDFFHRSKSFYNTSVFVGQGERLELLPVPPDAIIRSFSDQLLITLRSAWTVVGASGEKTWPAGATLATGLDAFLGGSREFTMLYEPGPRKSLASIAILCNALIINEREELAPRAFRWHLEGARWSRSEMVLPPDTNAVFSAVDADASDAAFLIQSSPIHPATLSLVEADMTTAILLKSAPALFDAREMHVLQHQVASSDGTLVPYVLVTPRGFAADASRPTILYAYGGFEVSLLPLEYNPVVGAAWLEEGGVYAVAGIRGGGEFGVGWHQSARLENKQRSYDDLIAVAEDLLKRRITKPAHLAIRGRSNGGLLVGAVMVQRPELFKAVVCEAPLLDMRRFSRLLAGASWVDEYGDPDDPDQWRFIARYSPYQNLQPGTRYPRVFLLTSTQDDRVHPGHARKMVAKLEALGASVLYFENTEGGHAGSADGLQAARMGALSYAFLSEELR